MLNQLLGGRYRVIEVLGEGGLGKTYIAEDQFQPSHPQCAVKLLKPASEDSSFLPIARRLFFKEAEVLEKLGNHHQIPQLLAYFEENKEFFIVQEFIEGHTLGTELPLGHRWTENKVILMLQDVLKTLEFVHGYDVIHRDLKPNNLIRRDKDGKIVLIDFGAVKQVSDSRITTKAPLTPKTISIGTQGYMPTEQARGKPRLSSDIYALGMIGIQALTGIDPFNLAENNEGEVIWQDYAPVSEELAAILNQMVRYHFRDRYKSTTEVIRDLESLNSSVVTPKVSKSSQEQVATLSEVESRETKVSLSSEEFAKESVVKEEKDTVDSNQEIVQEFPIEELRETKVSLDSQHRDQEVDLLPQTKRKDPWSTWKIDSAPKSKQENSTDADLETGKDVWGLSESQKYQTKQPVESDNLNSEIVPTVKSKVTLNPEIKETKISIEDKVQDNDPTSKINLKETKVSLKEQQLIPSEKPKETKVSSTNQNPAIKKGTKISLNDTKVSISSEEQNIVNSSTSSKSEKINNNLSFGIKSLNLGSTKIKDLFNSITIKPSIVSSVLASKNQLTPDISLPKSPKKIFLISTGIILILFGFYNGIKYLKHKHNYHQIKLDLEEIAQFKLDQKFSECIEQGTLLSDQFSDLNILKNSLLESCYQGQLTTAKELAKQNKYKDASNLIITIPQDHRNYAESQKLLTQWSENIYQIATNNYQAGNLEAAIKILRAIPEASSLHDKIPPTIQEWKLEWLENKETIEKAEQELKEKRWQDAISKAKQVTDHPYWQKQSQKIITQAEKAIAAQTAPIRTYSPTPTPTPTPIPTPTPTPIPTPTSTPPKPLPPDPDIIKTPLPPLPPLEPLPENPLESSSTKPNPTSIVCLNKHSNMPKCRK